MQFLIVFKEEMSQFDKDEVRKIFEDIPGTSEIKEGDFCGDILQGDFDYKEDSTTVRLSEDLKTISIHGTGDASLQLSLEIQRRYAKPLRVTNLDYGFDFFLTEISSVSDFVNKMREAYSMP